MSFDFYRVGEPAQLAPLFGDWGETIVWGALDGTMGELYANAAKTAAAAVLGDFAFCAAPGLSAGELQPFLRGLQAHIPHKMIFVARDDATFDVCKSVFGRVETGMRYATKKHEQRFDAAELRVYAAALPAGYTLSPMTPEIWEQIAKRGDWLKDFTSNFKSYDEFISLQARGSFVLFEGEIVCGASSYSVYQGGLEVQIETSGAHRRQGLARACAAQLLLGCMEAGLYPAWDAANLMSISLAQQLGYRFSHTYRCLMLPTAEAAVEAEEKRYSEAVEKAKALVIGEAVPDMANLSALLFETLDRVNWVGFYTRDGEGLLLGPFQGKPACLRIQAGRGVCGTALQRAETLVVPDVHAFPGHIACDSASESEIVVPVVKNGMVQAVLDADSPIPERFTARARQFLEQIAAVLAPSL